MITTQTLTLLTYSSLFILLSILLETCNANCNPSSCGQVRNISHPFRLSNDPTNCGDPRYELACENDVAFVYLNSQKYYVKEINYRNLTIRVADVSINSNTSFCSSPPPLAFENSQLYALFWDLPTNNRPINFISCSYPMRNSSFFTQAAGCDEQVRHTYIKVGDMLVGDMDYMCTFDSVFLTSWDFSDLNNVSVSEVRRSLLYGFDLSWCKCKDGSFCFGRPEDPGNCYEEDSFLYHKWKQNIRDSFRSPHKDEIMIYFQPFEAVVFAGVTIPAKIIIGFGSFYLVLGAAPIFNVYLLSALK